MLKKSVINNHWKTVDSSAIDLIGYWGINDTNKYDNFISNSISCKVPSDILSSLLIFFPIFTSIVVSYI